MLTDYNGRLAGEMDERKRVTRLLQDFTQSQKELLAQAERTLEVSGVSHRARRSCSPRQNAPWRLVGCHTESEGAARPGRTYPGG